MAMGRNGRRGVVLAVAVVFALSIPSTVHAQRVGHAAKGQHKGAAGHGPGHGVGPAAGAHPQARSQVQAASGNRAETPSARANQARANVNARGGVNARPAATAAAAGALGAAYATGSGEEESEPASVEVSPPSSDSTGSTSSGSGLTPDQLKTLEGLQKELAGLKAGTPASPEQKKSVENRLDAVAPGTARPASNRGLADDLTGALAGGSMAPRDRIRLVRGLHTVMNGSNFQPVQVEAAMVDIRSALEASKVPSADRERILSRLKALSGEPKAGPPASSPKVSGS